MTTYDDRDLADDELAAALGELARSLTGTLDVEQALDRTVVRVRARRGRRLVATTAAAATVVGLVAMAAATGDGRPSVRTPATAPVASSPAPSTPEPVRTAVVDPIVPATTATAVVADPTVPPAASPVPTPAPTPARYDSTGGSISVRMDGGVLAIDGEPRPAPGWSVRVDDDGPTRVRVRFERDDRRSEIRIDLVDGRLEPRITDG